ncbi:MAG: MBOAT family protein [Oscillospiraceae bacterium]|nr:MBOAT family protein [Oscillospiraceae bacterium]
MVFSSLTFLWVFLPIVLILYQIFPQKGRNGLLLAASLLFYAWGEPVYILLMLVSITLNYIGGFFICKATGSAKKWVLTGVIGTNLLLLGYFKYGGMFAAAVNALTRTQLFSLKQIALPIGISFYTFQALSYIIDLYREKISLQKSWVSLALYISFFPQLIAGPIVQYETIEQQLQSRSLTWQTAAYGVKRFIYGLAKKVILANSFAAAADRIFGMQVADMSTAMAWLGVLLYTLQIYYDFSGYSDMAIGLGRLFGFTFLENFNYPYLSRSVTEFWRRWHISLSSWFRDYLYIPLGGNRHGAFRTYLNLMIVFFCTGLWHGASIQFIAWGLYFGVFLIAERVLNGVLFKKEGKGVIGCGYTLLVVMVGWVFFRAPGMHSGLAMLKKMFIFNAGNAGYTLASVLNNRLLFLMIIGILGCGFLQKLFPAMQKLFYDEERTYAWQIVYQAFLLFISLTFLVSNTYNPFIYFRF